MLHLVRFDFGYFCNHSTSWFDIKKPFTYHLSLWRFEELIKLFKISTFANKVKRKIEQNIETYTSTSAIDVIFRFEGFEVFASVAT